MGLQLILNVEARKIEGYATQSNVPGPVVNLSLLATGPSLNKNQQAEKLSSLSVSLLFMVLEFMLLLPISPAKMRQDTDNPIICWLSSNFMVVQYQRSNIVGWRLHKLECFFLSPNMSRIWKKIPWKPLQNHNKTWTCLRKPPNIEQIHTHTYIYIYMLNIDSRFPKQFISQWETQKSSANPRNLGSLSSLATQC